jgi:hypothetical protein
MLQDYMRYRRAGEQRRLGNGGVRRCRRNVAFSYDTGL